MPVRRAGPDDAAEVAALLHDFNAEYDTPTPGVPVLEPRLRSLLSGSSTVALLAGAPAVGLALVTFRPNVWYDGPVALLDELYVRPSLRGQGIGSALLAGVLAETQRRGGGAIEINVDEGDIDARRFYERHGYRHTEPGSSDRMFCYVLELDPVERRD